MLSFTQDELVKNQNQKDKIQHVLNDINSNVDIHLRLAHTFCDYCLNL